MRSAPVRVTCWGVRGSIPTPGMDTQRWGGNSSCIEVQLDGSSPLVLDCGTGARKLGYKLVSDIHPGGDRELDLLFTHLHMDHVFGFPFFVPIYTPGYAVRVSVPAFSDEEAKEKLARYLNGTYHPTRLREVPANLTFRAVRGGRPFQAGGFTVRPIPLNHPGGSMGYRIEGGGASVAYLTDTAPFARPGEGVAAGRPPSAAEERIVAFLQGCDVVLYDTMYDYQEYLEKMTWGHSYPEYAEAICRAAGVRRLVLFHHLPDASDEYLDELSRKWSTNTAPTVILAREGEVIEL
ncbi:MAG: MBL fold metallo-hydrolase [Myxococcota bacterium]